MWRCNFWMTSNRWMQISRAFTRISKCLRRSHRGRNIWLLSRARTWPHHPRSRSRRSQESTEGRVLLAVNKPLSKGNRRMVSNLRTPSQSSPSVNHLIGIPPIKMIKLIPRRLLRSCVIPKMWPRTSNYAPESSQSYKSRIIWIDKVYKYNFLLFKLLVNLEKPSR